MQFVDLKKIFFLFTIYLSFACYADDGYRVFTGTDGRVIEARIISYDARSKKLTVERQNKQKVSVPVTIFSDADQVYIKEWISVQDFLSDSKLRISIQKKKGRTGSSKSQTTREKPPCYYQIELQNRSSTALPNIEVAYCMYMKRDSLNGGADELTFESEKLGKIEIPPRNKHRVMTKKALLFRYYERHIEVTTYFDGTEDTDTSYNKIAEDDVEGIRVRAYLKTPSGNVFMREVCDPSSLGDKYAWKEPVDMGGSSFDRSAAANTNDPTAGEYFSWHDGNDDGQVTLEEYLYAKAHINRQKFNKGYATKKFHRLDVNGDGYLVPQELNNSR